MLTDSSFCAEHATVERDRRRVYDRDRQDDQCRKLKNTEQWERTRKFVLARDNAICAHCGKPATDVDHIVPARKVLEAGGNFYDTENLQALCKSCHSRKTAIEDSTFVHRGEKRASA